MLNSYRPGSGIRVPQHIGITGVYMFQKMIFPVFRETGERVHAQGIFKSKSYDLYE
jgi:hypothetical protein